MTYKWKKSYEPTREEEPKTGTHFSLLLLVIPIGCIIWAANSKVILPFDELAFLLKAVPLLMGSFALLWLLSFYKIRRSKDMVMVTLVLFLFWFITGVLGLALLNTYFDDSVAVAQYSKVINKKTISSSSRGGGSYCLVWLENPLAGAETASLKYDECDSVEVGKDGVEIRLKDGALGMKWKVEHSVVKDIDTYRARLGV